MMTLNSLLFVSSLVFASFFTNLPFPASKAGTTSTGKSLLCDITKGLTDKALGKLPAGFTFLKTLKVDGEGGAKKTVTHSYVFSQGSTYSVNFANGVDEGVKITLLDSNGEAKGSGSSIQYTCGRTGSYKINFEFTGSDYCAASVVSIKR